MSRAPTIRERLERIRDLTAPYKGQRQREIDCHAEAQAILDALDAAELISEYAGGSATEKSHWRYIPDPQSASAEAKHAPAEACGSRVAPCGAQHGAPLVPDPNTTRKGPA